MKTLLSALALMLSISSMGSAKFCVELSSEGTDRIEIVHQAKKITDKRGLDLEVHPNVSNEKLLPIVATLKGCFEMIEAEFGIDRLNFSVAKLDNIKGAYVFADDGEFSIGPKTTIENCYTTIATEGLK